MDKVIRLIEAIAKLLGAVAWPVAVLAVAVLVLRRHRAAVDRAVDRLKSIALPGGTSLELSEVLAEQRKIVEAVKGEVLAEIEMSAARGVTTSETASRETRELDLGRLVSEARLMGRLEELALAFSDDDPGGISRDKLEQELAKARWRLGGSKFLKDHAEAYERELCERLKRNDPFAQELDLEIAHRQFLEATEMETRAADDVKYFEKLLSLFEL